MIIVRNILAVVIGIVIGMVVNMSLVNIGNSIFPVAGIDVNDMKAYAKLIPNLEAKYFIFPFLAHAIGTLVGALITALVAGNRKKIFALVIGVFFLIGGITVNIMLPGKIWFSILDIIVAYIPMSLLGWFIIDKLIGNKSDSIDSGVLDDLNN